MDHPRPGRVKGENPAEFVPLKLKPNHTFTLMRQSGAANGGRRSIRHGGYRSLPPGGKDTGDGSRGWPGPARPGERGERRGGGEEKHKKRHLFPISIS